MKKKRTKKYPVFTYLCYLLAVAALVTSVTFARYSVATSGSVSTQVALYNCSYEIDGFSSFAFNNTDFYIMNGNNLIGNTTARTVRFTMRNYKVNEEGKPIEGTATDVNVQGSIRLRVPAELGDKLAIQLTDATAAGASSTVVTPQIVLGELLYARVENGGIVVDYPKDNSTEEDTGEGDITEGDTTDEEKKQVIQTGTEYADFGSSTTLETKYFSDYEELTNEEGEEDITTQTWTVSGGLKTDDGVTSGTVYIVQNVDEGTGLNMTITAETDEEPETYSVGFRRSAGTSLFLDLSKKMTYYTIEISLPSMLLTGGDIDHCTHVAYLSLVNRLANSVYWYNLDVPEGTGDTCAIGDLETEPIPSDINNDGVISANEYITGYIVNGTNGRVYDPGNSSKPIYYITEDNLVYNAAGKVIKVITNMDQLITNPPKSGERYYIERGENDIEIIGYHFEQTVPVVGSTTNKMTNVRVNCKYNNSGGYTVTLDHVAPIEAGAANYVHSIESFLDSDGQPASPTLTNLSYISTPFAGLTGTCSNNVSTINLSSVTLNPFTNAENQVTVQMAVNRSFNLRMKAAFVQASTLPGS